jgi:hypothetical protein
MTRTGAEIHRLELYGLSMLRADLSGSYHPGSLGTKTARAAYEAIAAAAREVRPDGLILGMEKLDYAWGDGILSALYIPFRKEFGDAIRCAVLASQANHEALRALWKASGMGAGLLPHLTISSDEALGFMFHGRELVIGPNTIDIRRDVGFHPSGAIASAHPFDDVNEYLVGSRSLLFFKTVGFHENGGLAWGTLALENGEVVIGAGGVSYALRNDYVAFYPDGSLKEFVLAKKTVIDAAGGLVLEPGRVKLLPDGRPDYPTRGAQSST